MDFSEVVHVRVLLQNQSDTQALKRSKCLLLIGKIGLSTSTGSPYLLLLI
jgi:hypothetical protein